MLRNRENARQSLAGVGMTFTGAFKLVRDGDRRVSEVWVHVVEGCILASNGHVDDFTPFSNGRSNETIGEVRCVDVVAATCELGANEVWGFREVGSRGRLRGTCGRCLRDGC